MRFGLHLSPGPTYTEGIACARAMGCESLQIFSGNPRGWEKRPLAPERAEQFRRAAQAAGLSPVIVHVGYLLNLACPSGKIRERTVAGLAEELRRAALLRAHFVVTHCGKHRGAGLETGIAHVAEVVTTAWKALDDWPCWPLLLLENDAGAGTAVGATFEEIGQVLERVPRRWRKRMGVCLDTAHALSAGYELRTPAGAAALRAQMEHAFGAERVKCLHVNDSLAPLGTHRDRHAHLGRGEIGERGFVTFFRHCGFAGLPAILETPKQNLDDDARNLAEARRLYRKSRQDRREV